MPLKNLLLHLSVFLIALTYSYNTAKLPEFREYTVYMKLKVLGQWELYEEGIGSPVEIEESEITELEGRKAFLFIRKPFYIPESRRIEIFGNVKVKDNRIFISSYGWDVEELPSKNNLRNSLMAKFKSIVKEEHLQAIGLAFLFGESKRNLTIEVESAFLHTGLIHVLVVSGLHVGLVFLILSKTLPRFLGMWVGLIGVLFYFFFIVPQNPPVIRATSMILIYIFSQLSFRQYCSLCSLFFSSSVMLFLLPHFVFSYSFWLSFFAVLYIVLTLKDLKVNNYLKSLLVSLAAFTGTAPLIASFSFITPLSVLLTPVLSPLIFAYALFSIISLITFFSFIPTLVFMNLSGEIVFRILNFFSDFSPKLLSGITSQEAFIVSLIGAAALYFTRGLYRLIPLLGINLYLILR